MLDKNDVIAYVGANASRFGIDPAAILAVANHEGLKTQPGTTWVLPNESGFNFGPPSWYSGGAGAKIVAQQGASAAYWAWTPAGLDYWMQQVADSGAAGLTGVQAITAIVQNFENPRADLVGGEIINASHDYASFQQQLQSPLPGNIIVPTPGQPGTITIPGQTGPGQLPTPTNPQQPANPQTTIGAKFSIHLLDTPGGPINFTLPWDFSGILLFLAALFAIIIGALLWKPSRSAIVNVGQGAALAA
ncbi:MAG TPA: hypothetical protein VH593_29185 [Ktedonobacteraceae bacterium]